MGGIDGVVNNGDDLSTGSSKYAFLALYFILKLADVKPTCTALPTFKGPLKVSFQLDSTILLVNIHVFVL